MDACKIGVIGATGAVGRVFLQILEERKFPVTSIRLCASNRSVGRKLEVSGEMLVIEEVTPEILGDVDIAFLSVNGDVSRELAPVAVKKGTLVIDDSSAFRMEPEVPLVVPEVNADDIEKHEGIISIPNCSTTPLVMVLKPLHDINPVKRVVVDTYQSVSGTGGTAMDELRSQSDQILTGKSVGTNVYPHQIAFNALPHVEHFLKNGYTNEEMKMVMETKKILHASDIAVSSTCVRVPVMVSHSEAVHVELTHPINVREVRDILSKFDGIQVVDDPDSDVYPMPIEAAGKDEVLVGRIRQDLSHPNGIAMWISCDNLRKGAALNAIQIAEEILSRGIPLTRGRSV